MLNTKIQKPRLIYFFLIWGQNRICHDVLICTGETKKNMASWKYTGWQPEVIKSWKLLMKSPQFFWSLLVVLEVNYDLLILNGTSYDSSKNLNLFFNLRVSLFKIPNTQNVPFSNYSIFFENSDICKVLWCSRDQRDTNLLKEMFDLISQRSKEIIQALVVLNVKTCLPTFCRFKNNNFYRHHILFFGTFSVD